jgi:hypothetical protein
MMHSGSVLQLHVPDHGRSLVLAFQISAGQVVVVRAWLEGTFFKTLLEQLVQETAEDSRGRHENYHLWYTETARTSSDCMGMRRVCSTALSRSTSAGGRAEYPGPVRRHHTSRRSHVCLRAAGNTAPTGDSDPVLAAKRTRLEALLSQEGTELSTSSSGRGVQVRQ